MQLSRSIHLSVHVHKSPEAMAERAAHIIADACEEAISERGEFKIALSGGKTPLPLFRLLSQKDWVDALPWYRISVFWVDERCVPTDSPMSNYGVARRELLSYVPCTQFFRMRGEDSVKGALQYEETLRREFHLEQGELPRFDMVVLGMGSDGHTASLFDREQTLTTNRMCMDRYDPRKQIDRITLTLPVLNNARNCMFIVTGKHKHPVLAKALNLLDEPTLPCQFVKPRSGNLVWVVDEAAATGQDPEPVE